MQYGAGVKCIAKWKLSEVTTTQKREGETTTFK